MRYTIYEDRRTRRFAFLPLPAGFVDGDTLQIAGAGRWFASHADAIAALGDLLDREDVPEVVSGGAPPDDHGG
jgi:hypothetical protein